MKTLFNKYNTGGEELVKALGMIADNADFSKWEPALLMAHRQLSAIVGSDVTDAIAGLYAETNGEDDEVVQAAQRAVAFFAWHRIIPTLDAQHGTGGRQRKLGENEKGLTALQEYKDEQNVLNMAYESVDLLFDIMENGAFPFWQQSRTKAELHGLLIRSKYEFDRYYHIGSHRLFFSLLPMIREVQTTAILSTVGGVRLQRLQEGDEQLCGEMLEECQRVIALLTMKKAVERLPVEVLPDGVVQVQQTGSVKEKLRAERETRRAVAVSLGEDAARYLQDLQDIINRLDDEDGDVDYYMPGATLQSKGISF